jgi:mono/diheme cytochrome c family protein
LRSFNHVNLFTADIGSAVQYSISSNLSDTSATVAKRARDYLQANCAQCHQPNGPTSLSLDLRASVAQSAMNAIDVVPAAGNLGLTNARIIASGAKERSVLWERIRRSDPANGRMPPLASHAVDQQAVDLIGQWIDGL